MSTDTAVATATPITTRGIQVPPIGTPVPHLGGTFWAVMRSKPGSGEPDYALIVPHGAEFERQDVAWGGAGKDEPGAACTWDGLANTRALAASKTAHPAAEFCVMLNQQAAAGLPQLYLPSQRELHALYAAGCDAFAEAWYWSSTQLGRNYAWGQYFGGGTSSYDGKSWEGGRARAVRRASLESLIP